MSTPKVGESHAGTLLHFIYSNVGEDLTEIWTVGHLDDGWWLFRLEGVATLAAALNYARAWMVGVQIRGGRLHWQLL